MRESDLEKLRSKRLIFTVTTGRSGTKYLAQRLDKVSNKVIALHEPKPRFSSVMRMVQSDADLAVRFLTNQKLPYIAQLDCDVYIETSHLFSKGFFEPTLALGLRPSIIYLKRSKRVVAESLNMLQTIPGRTESGLEFLLSPTDPGVLAYPNWEQANDYQLCYWYCLEVERRARHYREVCNELDLQFAEIEISEIDDPRIFTRLVTTLGIPTNRFTALFTALMTLVLPRRPANLKKDQKDKTRSYTDSEYEKLEEGVLIACNYQIKNS